MTETAPRYQRLKGVYSANIYDVHSVGGQYDLPPNTYNISLYPIEFDPATGIRRENTYRSLALTSVTLDSPDGPEDDWHDTDADPAALVAALGAPIAAAIAELAAQVRNAEAEAHEQGE